MTFENALALAQSNDYKSRFISEYVTLRVRLARLKKKIADMEGKNFKDLPFFVEQARAMDQYVAALEKRAVIEDINIWEV